MACSRLSNALTLMLVDCPRLVSCKLGCTSLTVLPKSSPSTPHKECTSFTQSTTFWIRSDCRQKKIFISYLAKISILKLTKRTTLMMVKHNVLCHVKIQVNPYIPSPFEEREDEICIRRGFSVTSHDLPDLRNSQH